MQFVRYTADSETCRGLVATLGMFAHRLLAVRPHPALTAPLTATCASGRIECA